MTVTGKLYFFVSGTYRNQLRNSHLFFRVCVIHRLFKVNIAVVFFKKDQKVLSLFKSSYLE